MKKESVFRAGFSAPGVLIATILCSIALGPGLLASGTTPPSSVQGAAGSVLPMELRAASSLAAGNPWTAATAYPTAIARYAFAQVGEDSYVISGIVLGADVVRTVRRYNATTNVWTTLANIPIGSEAPVGAFFNGKIYVADGGNDGPILRIYDIATNTWSDGPARPGPTSSYGGAAGAFNGNVYVVGGGFPPTTTLSIYNIASNTWSAGPAAPSPFLLGGYTQIGQFLYLVGGFTSTTGLNTTVSMRLDMATNTWSTGPVWTPQRADFALAAAGTKLIAIGGDTNGGSFFDPSAQVDELDTSTWPGGTWVPSPDNLPSARQANPAGFVSTGRVGGEIWTTGGIAPGAVFLNEHLFRAVGPLLLSAVSRKAHGVAGSFDIPLPLNGTTGIECRGGAVEGAHQVIFTFASPVTVSGASVTTGTGSATLSVSGAVVTINLTGVSNSQTIVLTLFGVGDGPNTSDLSVPIGLLLGDTNGDALVNAGDALQTRSRSGQASNAANFRSDLNLDGLVNAADTLLVRNNSGSSLPQWSPDARVTFDPAFSSTSFGNAKCLAIGSNGAAVEVLHLVSFDDRDGNREIYYKRSTDGGTSWTPDLRLTNHPAISHFPSIAASGSVVHLVWEEYRDGNAELYYKRSPDAGVSWGADTRLTSNPVNSLSPSVAMSGDDVHLTWFDQRDGNNEIYYKHSSDGGLGWGTDTRLTNNPSSSVFSAIAASGKTVHIAWEEHRDGNGEIYSRRSTDGGAIWSADTRLTNNSANSFSPAIDAAGSDVNIAWFDQRDGNQEIYNKHSADGGLSWGTDKRVTNNPGISNYPSVTLSGSNVHLVWFDERDGNAEIYYNRSTDRGATWGGDVRLTNDAARSTDPCVAVSGSTVHIVWTDARDNSPTYSGNYEIYHKRNPWGN